MELPCIRFADDAKLREEMDTLEDQAAIQGNLDMLEEQANRNLMASSKGKHKVLPLLQPRLGRDRLPALRKWPWGPSGKLNVNQ